MALGNAAVALGPVLVQGHAWVKNWNNEKLNCTWDEKSACTNTDWEMAG